VGEEEDSEMEKAYLINHRMRLISDLRRVLMGSFREVVDTKC